MLHLVLIFFWFLIFLFSVIQGENSQDVVVFLLFVLSLLQFVFLWNTASKKHAYALSPLHVFSITAFLFFSVMPSLSIFVNYHFVISDSDTHGVVKLLMTNFWAIYSFCFGYLFIIGKSQLTLVNQKRYYVNQSEMKRIILWAIVAGIIGVSSFLFIYSKIGSFDGMMYSKIGVALRGLGWLLRAAELLAVGGAILVIIAISEKNNKLLIIGLSMLFLYAFLRYPFQNRENVIKYFVMLLFMYLYSSNIMIRKSRLFAGALVFFAIVLLFPIMSLLRGGEVLGSDFYSLYLNFLFKDFNFSEVAAAIYAREELSGIIGFVDGMVNIFSSLIPRELYPNKPFPLSVIITSYVTPYIFYDVNDPYFSYATGYMGVMYVISGVFLVILFSLGLGMTCGLLIKRFRKRCRYGCKVEYKIIIGFIMYYLTIAIHKLDLANIITAIFIPALFLLSILIVDRINLKESNTQFRRI